MASIAKNPTTLTIGIIVVLVLLAGGVAAFKNKNTTATETESGAAVPLSSPAQSTAPVSGGIYNDGTYTASGSYGTPEGTETVSITLTVKTGIITAASGKNLGISRESKEYQADFITALPGEVVGKKISEVSISRLAGSSLTSNGFNKAVTSIRAQAS